MIHTIYFIMPQNEYDEEPVWYCNRCLSLAIVNVVGFDCCCNDCGCTDVRSDSIGNWEKMYKERYDNTKGKEGHRSEEE